MTPFLPRPDTAQEVFASPLLIWGIHPVSELLRHQPEQVTTLFMLPGREDERSRTLLELAEKNRIPVERPAELPLEQAENVTHQGVAAAIKPVTPMALNTLLPKLDRETAPLLLALDSIQDPHNLGAIIRSAAAFGVNGLIIPKDRSAQISGTVIKAAAGTLPLVPICQVTNLAASLAILKDHRFWIYGAAGEAGEREDERAGGPDGPERQSLYATAFSGPICLVMGGEQKGIRPLVRQRCDFLVSIPLATGVESLNVSVAAAVILAEIRRPRTV